MVSETDLGILALLGVGAFFLFNRFRTDPFENAPPQIQSIEVGKALQTQFDTLGETLEEQDSVIKQLQRALSGVINPASGGLNQANIPSGSLLGVSGSGQSSLIFRGGASAGQLASVGFQSNQIGARGGRGT